MQGGVYVAKAPEFAAVADTLNKQIQERDARLAELADPATWFKKYGEPAIDPRLKTLEEQIGELKARLEAATPKPQDVWVSQNRDKLYAQQNGQQVLTPAGHAYNQTWNRLASEGKLSEADIHDRASLAANAVMQFYQPPASPVQPAQPPQTFMQAAAGYQPQPGFNLPGTPLSNGNPQPQVFANSRGFPDWDQITAGVLNGTISR
jgi:hypothetical protein